MNAPIETAWVGGMYFQRALPEFGIDAVRIPHESPGVLDWDDVVARAGFEPQLVIYADRSLPPPLLGIERFPCLTGFYCIDSHIHGWYPTYAQGFDFCALSLKDDLPSFRGRLGAERLLWLPPCPSAHHAAPAEPPEKTWDLLFAGTVDPETTPERHRFLARLKRTLPELEVRRGNFAELFPKARLVLNIAERGDLNFRVFEALACGACLVTPRIANGQDELFRDGEHLFTYDPADTDGLVALVRELLADPARMSRVAAAGHAEVERAHRARNRAETLARFVRSLDAETVVAERLRVADAVHAGYLRVIYLHWAEELRGTPLGERYLHAGMRRPA